LAPEIVEMLLHCAQLGLAGAFGIPPHQRLNAGLDRIIGLDSGEIPQEPEHPNLLTGRP
jgi:hypothetical protein